MNDFFQQVAVLAHIIYEPEITFLQQLQRIRRTKGIRI
jgi:hypothetical protein